MKIHTNPNWMISDAQARIEPPLIQINKEREK